MKSFFAHTLLLTTLCLLSSCEAPYVGSPNDDEDKTYNVTLRAITYEQTPFNSRAVTNSLSEVCSRIGFAIFDETDTKVKSINQTSTTEDFGIANFTLKEGNYHVVVIAHQCDGTATISSPSKITFPKNVVSDTFYYYGNITVGSEEQTNELLLTRAVAKFHLEITDEMPSDVQTMRFYYTGGSSTFSARDGFGNVNSKQTVKIPVLSTQYGHQTEWDLYTMPHDSTDVLKMTISALDANENVLYMKELTEIPVTINRITNCSISLFSGEPAVSAEATMQLSVDPEWSGTDTYTPIEEIYND
ncbi:MAG: FimB/Mfa2 family fimbrial subunit [Bacteroidaceae bacterium]|nr:FimB/Mfa2 family fimbrial subunit [Bacteroidaceae bacterium]